MNWFQATDNVVAAQVRERISTAVLLINGTRRWFLTQRADWDRYPQATAAAHRRVSQLLFDHGIGTLIQPLLGFDLIERGEEYLELALRQSLTTLADEIYLAWYRAARIRVSFYGAWRDTLPALGFEDVAEKLDAIVSATERHTEHHLLLGLFADRALEDIVRLANDCHGGPDLIERYYGVDVPPIDLIIGSGQPALWDIPLLDFNRASLYFLKTPTFFITREMVRRILYDHLFERVPDDNLESLPRHGQELVSQEVLGIGRRTPVGWVAQ